MADKKIKVLHIIKSLGRGGAEMLLPETLRLHDKNKFEFFCIYFLPWKNQMVDALNQLGAKVECFPANNNFQLIRKVKVVAKFVKENEIQLIHAHLPWAGVLARYVGRLTGIPVLYTEHNKQERYHFLTRFLNLRTMHLNTRVIAVSQDVKDSLLRHSPHLKVPVETVLNGVNIDYFSPALQQSSDLRHRFSIPENAPIIGTVAVFRVQKRLDLWLELARQIVMKKPGVHFILVGDGPLKPLLEKKRSELGLENQVHFAGLQTEPLPFFRLFDIYMMSSIFEGLPLALLESMACGCPVISTDAGGIKEVIHHGQDGFLCPVDDPSQLAGMAITLLENEQLRKSIGLSGRKTIEENFSMKRMVSDLENMYNRHAS